MMDKHDDLIPRPFYIEKIRPFMGTHLIKVLTGQRRTGKSYLLYQLMDELRKADPEASFLYINPELADYRTLRTGYDLYDYIKAQHPTLRTNLFIDEIQEFSGFEHCLKSLFAENLCDIYCSGSNASLLGGELATYLAGRYIQIEVHPLSYREFLDFYGRTHSRESLELYLHIGGMPYLASLSGLPQSEHLSMEYLKNIYESILLRDVVARENIRNIPFLEQLIEYTADNVGNVFSATNISKYLKSQKVNIPVQTVLNYLGALERAYFLRKARRIDVKGLRKFETNEKYYFEDIGLRNLLAKTPEAGDINKVIENAVFNYLVQHDWSVNIGVLEDREIDFAAEKGQAKVYIQAAWRIGDRETAERELKPLEAVGDSFPKYLVTFDEPLPAYTASGIRCIRLGDFLLKDGE